VLIGKPEACEPRVGAEENPIRVRSFGEEPLEVAEVRRLALPALHHVDVPGDIGEHPFEIPHERHDLLRPRITIRLPESGPPAEVREADPQVRILGEHWPPELRPAVFDQLSPHLEAAARAVNDDRKLVLDAEGVDLVHRGRVDLRAQRRIELDADKAEPLDGVLERLEVLGALRVHPDKRQNAARMAQRCCASADELIPEELLLPLYFVLCREVRRQRDDRIVRLHTLEQPVGNVPDLRLERYTERLDEI
jgi:hypothetical protein